MPWQQLVSDVAGELDPATGLLWYRQVVVHVMRQQGKTTWQLPKMVDRCISWPASQHVTYAAQSGVAARDKLLDEHVPLLLRSPLASAMRVRRTSGHEAILWKNGSRHTLTAAKESSGHGAVLDEAVVDEAFAYTDARLEQAFMPAMQTRPDPQLVVTSTAGYSPESSPWLWSKVVRGREIVEAADPSSRVAYFEWSFGDDDDPFDEATWWARMPALGFSTGVEAIRSAAESMEQREFLRAYGNVWGRVAALTAIDPVAFHTLTDGTSAAVDPVAFAVSMPMDRGATSIGMAGDRADGVGHVEVVDHRSGTDWVVDRLVELQRRWRPSSVALDPGSAAGSLVDPLIRAGVELTLLQARDVAQAAGGFFDAVSQSALRHRGDPLLLAAVAGAGRRQVGEAWAFSSKGSAVNIAPLVACSLALWAHQRASGSDITHDVW